MNKYLLLLLTLTSFLNVNGQPSRDWQQIVFISHISIKTYDDCSPHKAQEIQFPTKMYIYKDGEVSMLTESDAKQVYTFHLKPNIKDQNFQVIKQTGTTNSLKLTGHCKLKGDYFFDYLIYQYLNINDDNKNPNFEKCNLIGKTIRFELNYNLDKQTLELIFFNTNSKLIERISFKIGNK